jgi:aminoglycoside 6'-N-acetyltransferase I
MPIRPFTTNDMEACAKLLMYSYKQPPWRYNWSFDQAFRYLTEYAEVKQFVGFVLVEREDIVGSLFGHTKTWWANDQLFIDELFISPQKQRSGYGRQLLEHAEQYSKDHGLKSMSLMTNKFTPAFNFYTKLNYLHAEQFVFLFKPI